VTTMEQITGLILAGGPGTRMGGLDKGLILLDGQSMVERAIVRLRSQVAGIVISANRHLDRYAQFGPRVVPDPTPGFPGPLAGIAAACRVVTTEYILIVPCDAPFLDLNLAARLTHAAQSQQMLVAVAHDGRRVQPLFMLVARSLGTEIEDVLARSDSTLEQWLAMRSHAVCRFASAEGFVSVDSTEDRAAIEAQLREQRLGHTAVPKKQSPLTRAFKDWRARRDSNSRPPGS
jgi:molybdenum cofactor guanylyltransferase